LNYKAVLRSVARMKKLILILMCASAFATSAQAQCFAEYKAKRDDPLRLHYGIMVLESSVCPAENDAAPLIQARLAETGWKLLNVIGVSKQTPDKTQKANAGEFYLRF